VRLDPGTTKNRDGRIVYLVPDVKDALTGQLMRVHTLERSLGKIIPFVFPSPRNRLKAGPGAWWTDPIVAPADLQDAAKRMAHTSLAQTRAHLEAREPRGAGNVLI
jgi:hypothetical protein